MSAQLLLTTSSFLVVTGRCLTLSPHSLLLLIHLLSMPLGLLRVLFGKVTVLGRLAPVRIDRLPQLLSPRCVSVRLLTVSRCFGGESLSHDPSLLGTAPDVTDEGRKRDQADYDYGDNENR